MVVKQQSSDNKNINRLPSGYEGTNIPTDFSIPACGIKDADRALFDLFDKEIGFQINHNNAVQKVPVIFSGGERFALIKNNKTIRDKDGALIIPLIAIKRTNIDQSLQGYGGRGLGQNTGELVIKRRLSEKDPAYQSIINKAQLSNQDNVASVSHLLNINPPVSGSRAGTIATRRGLTARQHATGEVLENNLNNNIFEVITMPFPQFFVATYEIVLWGQYIAHMNTMIEKILSSYHAQGNQFKITSNKGYWFVAYFQDDITAGDNTEDYTNEERIIKYTFTVKVQGYIIAVENSGDMIPLRKFLSAPQIAFQMNSDNSIAIPQGSEAGTGDVNKFTLNEIVELDKNGNPVLQTGPKTKLVKNIIRDPFTGKETFRYVQVLDRNQRAGETVASSRLTVKLDDIGI